MEIGTGDMKGIQIQKLATAYEKLNIQKRNWGGGDSFQQGKKNVLTLQVITHLTVRQSRIQVASR